MEDYKKRIKKFHDEIKNMSTSPDEYPSIHPSRKLIICRLLTVYFPEVDDLYPKEWFKSLDKKTIEEFIEKNKDIIRLIN